MDLNLKRFLAYYGKIILMPEILMSVYSCIGIKYMVRQHMLWLHKCAHVEAQTYYSSCRYYISASLVLCPSYTIIMVPPICTVATAVVYTV